MTLTRSTELYALFLNLWPCLKLKRVPRIEYLSIHARQRSWRCARKLHSLIYVMLPCAVSWQSSWESFSKMTFWLDLKVMWKSMDRSRAAKKHLKFSHCGLLFVFAIYINARYQWHNTIFYFFRPPGPNLLIAPLKEKKCVAKINALKINGRFKPALQAWQRACAGHLRSYR